MTGWLSFWTIVLIVSVVVYFAVALLAGIMGARDLRNLIAGRTRADDDAPETRTDEG